jgi:hypothetical protein
MPQTVVRFERLAYLSIVLGVLAYYNAFYHGIALHQGLDIFDTLVAGVIAAAYLIVAALIFAAARRRQNGARWVYSVLIALGVALNVGKVLKFRDVLGFDLVALLDAASDIAAIASVYFAFSRPSNSWFRSSLSASEDRPR